MTRIRRPLDSDYAGIGVWFPTVRTGTGTDVFTERLCKGLNASGVRAEITWLPHRAEYLPWTLPVPVKPAWADIVHVNTWLHPRFIPDDVPVVATLHHSVHDPVLRPYKGPARAAYHRFWIAPNERRVMARADRVVAVSRFAADMARQTLRDVPTQVIHNGIDTGRFRQAQGSVKPHSPFRLLYVGSWMARKGVDLLAPIMRELGEGFVLHYTGGPAAESDKVTMPPNMIDVGRLSGDGVLAAMQQADALLFPTRSEGFGLVAAEAMACGLPVIATDAASIPEVVEADVSGILCRQDDVQAFVAAARRLASSARLLRMMSGSSAAIVAWCFDHDGMVEAYRSVYESLMSSQA
ncbi:glycosyltransferase family 4 protein [Pseudoxanthomonas sp. LjRoot143]|uniref:glycosyltransferase family 4 protein n=1 Tax=Pseudoxanthomonas sp. LjRoot143 TaxID=3342266 RepID=UPI003ECD80A2